MSLGGSTHARGAQETEQIDVLHVDDDQNFVEMAAELLEQVADDIEVTTTTDPATALERIDSTPVDCVVSDYDMPGWDGIEFLRELRACHPELPFVLFTGKGSEAVAADAISAGATDYLQKETGSDQYTVLANRIEHAVESARARRRRERRLTAIETTRDGIAILDDEERFVYVNSTYADLYGYDPEELIGTSWERLYPEEETEIVRQEILPAVEETGYWHGRTTGLDADGRTFSEDHVLSVTEDGELVCTVRDISEREQRTQQLTSYRTLVEKIDDPVYVLDDEGRFEYVNRAFAELVGYDREEIRGSPPELVKGEAAVAAAERQLGRLLSDDGPDDLRFEVPIQTSDGDTVVCEDHMAVLPYEGEEFEGSVGILRDVTERKRRARELERYETIIEAVGDPVYALDCDGRFTYVNDALVRTVGHERDDLLGEHVRKVMSEDGVERGESLIESLLSADGDRTATLQLEFVKNDGETICVENHVALLTDEDGELRGTAGVVRDITDRLAYERELQRQNERLDEFASVVAHDLRNPLNVATGRAELLATERDDPDEHLDALTTALDRMEALLDALLALAREGEAVTDPEPVSIAGAAERSWRTVSTASATLRVEAERTILAEESRLRQALENLFRNSVEHGGDDVTVTVGDLADGFYVADDGEGIAPDDRGSVFESGYTTASDGTGFGLTIVAEIAAAHDWTVTVEESESGGARFEITGVDRLAD